MVGNVSKSAAAAYIGNALIDAISIAGLLAGRGDMTQPARKAA
jgi:hypothetical protein